MHEKHHLPGDGNEDAARESPPQPVSGRTPSPGVTPSPTHAEVEVTPGFKPRPRGSAPFVEVRPFAPANLRPRLLHRFLTGLLGSSPLQGLFQPPPCSSAPGHPRKPRTVLPTQSLP